MAAFEPSPGTKGRDESVSFLWAVKPPKIPQDFKKNTAFRGGIFFFFSYKKYIIIILILPKINS